MKIPQRPPQTPLQDSILMLLQEAPRTKQELSEILDRPNSRIIRALRSLLVEGKIQQQIGEEMKYQLPTSDAELYHYLAARNVTARNTYEHE